MSALLRQIFLSVRQKKRKAEPIVTRMIAGEVANTTIVSKFSPKNQFCF